MNPIKKRFKIGEYAIGGIVDAEIYEEDRIVITAREWENPDEIIMLQTFNFSWNLSEIELWIETEITTSYYACKIVDWIKENINEKMDS